MMQKEYEIQIKRQIYESLKAEVNKFVNSKEFAKIPEPFQATALIGALGESTKQEKDKYSGFKEWFISENIPFISKFEFDILVQDLSKIIMDKLIEPLGR